MKHQFWSKFLFFSKFSSTNATPVDYELVHCNNPETNDPEMKFRISKQYYDDMLSHLFSVSEFTDEGDFYTQTLNYDQLEKDFHSNDCKFAKKSLYIAGPRNHLVNRGL